MAVGFRWCDHRWWHRSILQPAVPSATIQELLTLCKTLSQAHLDTLQAGNYEMAKTNQDYNGDKFHPGVNTNEQWAKIVSAYLPPAD